MTNACRGTGEQQLTQPPKVKSSSRSSVRFLHTGLMAQKMAVKYEKRMNNGSFMLFHVTTKLQHIFGQETIMSAVQNHRQKHKGCLRGLVMSSLGNLILYDALLWNPHWQLTHINMAHFLTAAIYSKDVLHRQSVFYTAGTRWIKSAYASKKCIFLNMIFQCKRNCYAI